MQTTIQSTNVSRYVEKPQSGHSWPWQTRRAGSPTFGLWLVVPALLFLLGFFILPLIDNTLRSLGSGSGDAVLYYRKLLTDGYYLRVTGATIALSAVVTVLSLVIGYP